MADFTFYTSTFPKGFKSKALTNALRNLGKLPEIMGKLGETLTKVIRRNLSGRLLNKRSGKLHNSWNWLVTAYNRGWRLVLSSDVVYARIHEFGGWTGRDHATKIKASKYVQRALVKKRKQITKLFRDYIVKITRN